MTGEATAHQAPAALAVGDPRRRLIGRAVLAALLTSAAFVACAYPAKQLASLQRHSPWQNDPYDAVISFTIFFVPLVAGLCLLRVPLCRRDQPLPVRRAVDLLRASCVALAAIILTLASDWVSVALRRNLSAWTGTTAALIAGLALLTALTAAAALGLRRAFGQAGTPGAAGPDWVEDVVTAAGRFCGRLGPGRAAGAATVRWLGQHVVPVIRHHPLAVAAAASAAFGAVLAALQAIAEPGGAAAWLFFSVGGCGMYAFIVIAGCYLRIVRRDHPARGPRRRLIDASVLACASLPVTVAFRASLASIVGSGWDQSLHRMMLLLFGVAAAAFAATFAAESLARSHRTELS